MSMSKFGRAADASYEWAGIFETPDANHVWIAQKVDGAYVDPMMDLVAFPSKEATEEALEALVAEGELSMGLNCSNVSFGDTIVPMLGACYRLHFDDSVPTTTFKVDSSGAKSIAFFAQHVPTEFERDAHYLKNSTGADIEPQAELPHKKKEPATDWGAPILAAVIVNLITLVGVVFVVPGFKKLSENHPKQFESILSAFAAGAILSCAFFLLLFEATHLIGTGWKEEVDVLWRWGAMVLAGFSLPGVCESAIVAVASFMAGAEVKKPGNEGVEVTKMGNEQESELKQADNNKDVAKQVDFVTRMRLISSILLGDFAHNMCDGFFLGAAFSGCGNSFGWRVAVGTIAHEFAQELADYAVLTSPEAAMSPALALALNFLSGLGVILGVVIILASEVSEAGIGMLLAFGGGVYIHVAATDLMPKIYEKTLSLSVRMSCLCAFFVGAIGIGLVLLDHEHCVPGGGEHGH